MNKILKTVFLITFMFTSMLAYGETGYKTVRDHIGDIVKIPLTPKRIIALNPSIMEGLYELGMSPIAKVDEYKIRLEGKELPSVGSQLNINIENIYRLKPDLILANSRNHGNIKEILKGTGAAVYIYNPSKLGKQPFYDIPIFLGELFGLKNKAENYLDNLNNLAQVYSEKIQKDKEIKTGIIIGNPDNITAYQKATGYGTILASLGISNIVPDNMPGASKEAAVHFSIENIYKYNPDLILISASTKNPENNREIIERLKNDSQWKNLKAVKNNNIKVMPFKLHPGRSKKEEMIRMMAETILKN